MDTMEGQFLWPLLSHLIIIPAFYGAAIYYILMIILAIISSVVPYLLGGAVIGSIILYFKWGKGLNQRKFRYALLTLITLFFGVVFSTIFFESGNSHLNETVSATAPKQFLKCVENQINLRQQPTTATYNTEKFKVEYPQLPTEQIEGRNHLQIEKMTDEQLNKIFQTASPVQVWIYYFTDINNVI